jgi:membrane associated rhomboid family serine protease
LTERATGIGFDAMTPWVLRLIVATVVMHFIASSSRDIFMALLLLPSELPQRPWTLVTYMFLHAPGLSHILFNMLALFMFGPPLERRLGGNRFLGLYFAGGIGGALLSLAQPNVAIVGASAATFAVSLGFARYWPDSLILIWGIIPVRAWMMVGLMTLLALFGAGGLGERGVAHLAHLGGFAAGWVYLKVMEQRTGAAAFRSKAAPTTTGVSDDDLARWRLVSTDAMHPVNREEYQRVLAKVEAQGLASLSGEERAFLDRFAAPG